MTRRALEAAAPDMLAALQAIIAGGQWEDNGRFVYQTPEDVSPDESAIEAAMDAIARATGK